jgi:hypothetical protein
MRINDRDIRLAARLVELAESADADCGEAACAELVTANVAEMLAPSEIGILLTGDSGGVMVAAASSDRARDLVSFEAAHQEGPGTDCCSSSEQLLNAPLAGAASRWPGFAPAAEAAGVAVVSAFPLRCRARAVGSISVLAPGTGLLTVADADRVQLLARAAGIAIAQQREIRRSVLAASQLQRALDSRVVVEQAKGAVAARLGITPDDAFGLLRAYARDENRPLAEVAVQAVRGELALVALVAPRRADRGRAAQQRASAGQSR